MQHRAGTVSGRCTRESFCLGYGITGSRPARCTWMRPVLALSLPGTGPVLWGRGVLLPAQGRSGRRSCVSPGTRGHGLPTRHAAGVAEQPGGEEPALTETAWLLRGQRVPEYPWSSRWRKARMPIALQEGGFPGLEPPRSHGRPRRTGRDAWTVGRSDTGSSHGVPGCRQTPAPGWSARGMQQQSHWQLAARVGGSQGACGAAPVLAAWFKDTQPQPARFLRARSPRLPASPSSVTAPPTGGGTPSLHLHLSHQARAAVCLHAISSSVTGTHQCLSSSCLEGGPVLHLLKGHICPTLKAGGSVGPRRLLFLTMFVLTGNLAA